MYCRWSPRNPDGPEDGPRAPLCGKEVLIEDIGDHLKYWHKNPWQKKYGTEGFGSHEPEMWCPWVGCKSKQKITDVRSHLRHRHWDGDNRVREIFSEAEKERELENGTYRYGGTIEEFRERVYMDYDI